MSQKVFGNILPGKNEFFRRSLGGPRTATKFQKWSASLKRLRTAGLDFTFTPPESVPSGQFWCIYALIGGVRVGSGEFVGHSVGGMKSSTFRSRKATVS